MKKCSCWTRPGFPKVLSLLFFADVGPPLGGCSSTEKVSRNLLIAGIGRYWHGAKFPGRV